MTIPRAPRVPNVEGLENPLELTLAFFARRRVERAKAAASADGATVVDAAE